MKSEDLRKAPKLLCESVHIAFSPEYFIIGLTSGQQATVYSLTPQHAKRLQQYLTYQIAEYEKKHSTIEAHWEPAVISPVQPKKIT